METKTSLWVERQVVRIKHSSRLMKNCANLALLGLAFLCNSSAHAITIDGAEYNKVYSAPLDGYFGVWRYYQKGSTYTVHPTDLTVGVRTPNLVGGDLLGAESASRLVNMYMLPVVDYAGPLVSSTYEITGAAGQTLLSLELEGFGSLSTIRALGDAGEASLVGLYEVKDGSWFSAGTLLYATLNYTKGFDFARNDFYWTNGTFELFAKEAPPTSEVPEPTTGILLATAIAGIARRRRKIVKE